ncbi:hypothetical protein LOK49_LG08G01078 [Camellia lanceoleosa]|uniref:Uncharacterized protein n=1 Tax=Camellia lanceoleosa TaxID=1840588 RepID=A0ACC0GVV7_9ERIC|nr:hypothetical protein LOK49_LG08G01078 [Camellia lanceoleosa]
MKEVQAQINVTKKERQKIAQELEFGRRVEKRQQRLISIRNVEDYVAYRDEKLSRLKPVILDSLKFLNSGDEKDADDVGKSREGMKSSSRVASRNPKLAVYGGTLDDISKFFSTNDEPKAAKNPQGNIFLLLV